ncbi:hypothetical protein [Niabella soli]|uniref:hypothetical protein n=1 Tax=Niabella soli TaxID=446683 RepID=UPI0002499DBD|nr:hypothetical protein [Niabella soli]
MSFFDFLNGANNNGKKAAYDKAPGSWQDTSLEAEMRTLAQEFLKKYTVPYGGLDFSTESLKVLDQLLDDARGFYAEMSGEQQRKIIEGAGAYIFEVARKNVGGTYYWYQKLDQPVLVTGQPKFEAAILTFKQVRQRLENGKDDSIPVYFESYLEGVRQHRSAIVI